MEKDLRYKMRHMGDAFADQIEHLYQAIKGPFRGITLTYNIDGLRTEQEKVVQMIGKRMVALRENKGQDFISDDVLGKLFDRLDKIDAQIDANVKERKAKLCHAKT